MTRPRRAARRRGRLTAALALGWITLSATAVLAQGAAASTSPGLDRACVVQASPEPAPSTIAGCALAWCAGNGADALCVCQQSRPGTAPVEHRYQLAGDARQARPAWRAQVSPMLGPEAFSVVHADLDGDGVADRVVEQRQAVSNGMGVAYARLCVWPSASKADRPLCRDVEDWGYLSRLVQEPGRRACSLVDASWQPGRERGRGDGTYAVGRTWHLGPQGWVPAPGRPVMSRRLLKRFEQERLDALSTPAAASSPTLWYQSADTRLRR